MLENFPKWPCSGCGLDQQQQNPARHSHLWGTPLPERSHTGYVATCGIPKKHLWKQIRGGHSQHEQSCQAAVLVPINTEPGGVRLPREGARCSGINCGGIALLRLPVIALFSSPPTPQWIMATLALITKCSSVL